MFSSIKKKRCKCGCGKMPSISYNGWNYACAPAEIKAKVGDKRKQAQQRSYEKPKIRSLHSLPANRSMVEKKKGDKFQVDEKLEQWFLDRRKDMTGFCWCGCSKLSSKNDDKYFKFSACHLLMKSKFKSIMYHPLNFVELNFWEGHHTTFDNMGYEYCKNTKPVLWKIVAERFKILYPLIAPEERKFIPQVLLETLKTNKDDVAFN